MMSAVKLKEDKQKKLKVLSKIIEVVAIIAKVLCYIALVCVAFFAILVPPIINNFDIKEDKLMFNKNSILQIEENKDGITIKSSDNVIAKTDDPKEMKAIKDFFSTNTNKSKIICCIEFFIAIFVVIVILSIIFFKRLIKLFRNINKEETPFTIENIEHIRKMAYLMIALIIFPVIANIIISIGFNTSVDLNINFFNIMEVLFMFVLAYIFEYGYEIQKDSKGTIYDKELNNKSK